MKRKIWKRCILIVISCGFLLFQNSFSFACAPEPEEEPEISFLLPDLTDDTLIWQYVDSRTLFSFDEETLNEQRLKNLSEWQEFFWKNAEGIFDQEDIDFLIYEANLDHITEIYKEIQHHSLNSSEKNRLSTLISRISPQTLEYIIFAKQCEPHVAIFPKDSWEDIHRDTVAMQALLEDGKAKYEQCTSDFLKMRYAYQMIRLARYTGNYKECVSLYDELVAHLNVESIIRYWALDHKAGALRHIEKEAEALYLFSIVFDKVPERRKSAYRSFRMTFGGEEQWKQCLGYAQNIHESIILWMLWNSINGYGGALELLQHIYELNSSSPVLESMLIREVKRLEKESFPYDHGSSEYLSLSREFVLRCAEEKKVKRVTLWYIVAGYLALMEKLYPEASAFLDKAEALCNKDQFVLLHQINLLRCLVTLRQPETIDAEFEHQIYSELQWLVDRRISLESQSGEFNQQYRDILDSVLSSLAQKYLMQTDVAKAICCLLKTEVYDYYSTRAKVLLDIYSTQEDLANLYILLTKLNRSEFESFLIANFPFTPNEILDLQGTRLLRKHQFRAAFEMFKRIPEWYWHNIGGTRKTFETSFSKNEYLSPKEKWKFEKVNKFTFTQKILELEKRARENPKNADQYYWQIGNAFYHTPFWGYVGVVWQGEPIFRLADLQFDYPYYSFQTYPFNIEGFSERLHQQDKELLQSCGSRRTALNYYQKVLEITTDPELGAETAVLAHICKNPIKIYKDGYGKYFKRVENKSYLRLLKDRYAHTTIYDRMIEECATFRYFANQR